MRFRLVVTCVAVLAAVMLSSSLAIAQTLPVRTVGGTLSGNQTWYADTVYLATSSLTIPSGDTLTIEAGTIVKFQAVTGGGTSPYGIDVNGILDLEGGSGTPVYFTSSRDDSLGGDSNNDGASTTAGAGDWDRIQINNAANEIHDCVLRYGGVERWYFSYLGSLHCSGGSPIVRDNQFVYSASEGIRYTGTGSPEIRGNTITGGGFGIYYSGSGSGHIVDNQVTGGGYGIMAYSSDNVVIDSNQISGFTSHGIYLDNASPLIRGNAFSSSAPNRYITYQVNGSFPTYTGNTSNFNLAKAVGGTISRSGTWRHSDMPYVAVTNLTVDAGDTLTIEAGTIVKFQAVTGGGTSPYGIDVNGILDLEGGSGTPVYFTSSRDDSLGGDSNNDGASTTAGAGDWDRIQINNAANEIHDCVLRYGGVERWYFSYLGSLHCSGGSPIVRDNQFVYSASEGIRYTGTGSPEIRGNTITGGGFGIYYSGSGSGHIVDNQVTDHPPFSLTLG